MKVIINPATGKKIFVGGPTYKRLKMDPRYKSEVAKRTAKAKQFRSKMITKAKKKRSSIKYTMKDGPFCGPRGGKVY